MTSDDETMERGKKPYWRRARDLYEDDVTVDVGPTDDEVEEWAASERRRRSKWVSGPTEDEKMAWALRERRRRVSRTDERERSRSEDDDDDRAERRSRTWRSNTREAELALLGMWDMLMQWPMRAWDDLVETGREREDDILRYRRRRRVRYYEDD